MIVASVTRKPSEVSRSWQSKVCQVTQKVRIKRPIKTGKNMQKPTQKFRIYVKDFICHLKNEDCPIVVKKFVTTFLQKLQRSEAETGISANSSKMRLSRVDFYFVVEKSTEEFRPTTKRCSLFVPERRLFSVQE